MKKVSLFLLLSIFIFNSTLFAGEIAKQTFVYSIKDNDTLRLDKYDIVDVEGKKPCVIFVFGGGFTNGNRDNDFNAGYMRQLAKRGYVAIAIDYRLGMKDVKGRQGVNMMDYVDLLDNAISMAVEDLFDATSFVLKNADEWNINKEQIVVNGSSAGAVTVLQAEYSICTKQKLTEKLPNDFNYGGIIAFAGAIFTTEGGLKWENRPAPMMMFHGNGDSSVPYNKIDVPGFGLFGSEYIAEQLHEMQSPYYFYDVKNAAHEIASDPMQDNLPEIESFIQNYVVEKKPWMIHTERQEIGKPEIKKDFGIRDYIKSNYM